MTTRERELTSEILILRQALARVSEELLSLRRCVNELPEPMRVNVYRNMTVELMALKVYEPER